MADENRRFADKFALRMPDGMRDKIAAVAEANNRSMNAEIVARLDASLQADTGSKGLAFVRAAKTATDEEERFAKIEERLGKLEQALSAGDAVTESPSKILLANTRDKAE